MSSRSRSSRHSRAPLVGFVLLLAGLIAMAGTQGAVAKKRPTCFGKRATQIGTNHHDSIVAKPHAVVVAKGGGDKIRVAKGDHTTHIVCGGAGNDNIKLLTGDDRVAGGSGNDKIQAGNGDDVAVGDNANARGKENGKTGRDFIGGADGRDFLVGDNFARRNVKGGHPDKNVTGGNGPDVIIGDSASLAGNATGGADDPHLAGADANDLVVGDSYTVTGRATGGGNDHVDGGPDQDLQVGDGYTKRGTARGAGRDRVQGADGGDLGLKCQPANSCADVFYGDSYRAACAKSRSVADNSKVPVIRCENQFTNGGKPDQLTPDQGDDFMNAGLPDPDPGSGSGTTVDRCDGGTGVDTATSCKPIQRGFEKTLPFRQQ